MYFIANWKMFGGVSTLNSLKKVIKFLKTFKNLITFLSEFNVLNPPNIFQLAIKYIYLFVIYLNLIYRFAFYRSINLYSNDR